MQAEREESHKDSLVSPKHQDQEDIVILEASEHNVIKNPPTQGVEACHDDLRQEEIYVDQIEYTELEPP